MKGGSNKNVSGLLWQGDLESITLNVLAAVARATEKYGDRPTVVLLHKGDIEGIEVKELTVIDGTGMIQPGQCLVGWQDSNGMIGEENEIT